MIDVSLKDLDATADALRYTDDTHMMIGPPEFLIACGGFNGDIYIN